MKNYGKWTAAQRYKSLGMEKKLIGMGKLQPACKCRFCGQEKGILHTHDMNYDVNLEIFPKMIDGTATQDEIEKVNEVRVPLCWRCHMMLHGRFKHPKSYEKYMEEVKGGKMYAPVFNGGDFTQLEQHYID